MGIDKARLPTCMVTPGGPAQLLWSRLHSPEPAGITRRTDVEGQNILQGQGIREYEDASDTRQKSIHPTLTFSGGQTDAADDF
jgi:hypothetical protein